MIEAPKLTHAPRQRALVRRFTCRSSELTQELARTLPRAFAEAAAQGLMPGRPFSRLVKTLGDQVEIEAGVLLSTEPASAGEYGSLTMDESDVAVAIHLGPPDSIAEGRADLLRWVREQKRRPVGPSWEVYLTDPADEPDPSAWRTELVVPVGQ